MTIVIRVYSTHVPNSPIRRVFQGSDVESNPSLRLLSDHMTLRRDPSIRDLCYIVSCNSKRILVCQRPDDECTHVCLRYPSSSA
jgi:hypothetical protein